MMYSPSGKSIVEHHSGGQDGLGAGTDAQGELLDDAHAQIAALQGVKMAQEVEAQIHAEKIAMLQKALEERIVENNKLLESMKLIEEEKAAMAKKYGTLDAAFHTLSARLVSSEATVVTMQQKFEKSETQRKKAENSLSTIKKDYDRLSFNEESLNMRCKAMENQLKSKSLEISEMRTATERAETVYENLKKIGVDPAPLANGSDEELKIAAERLMSEQAQQSLQELSASSPMMKRLTRVSSTDLDQFVGNIAEGEHVEALIHDVMNEGLDINTVTGFAARASGNDDLVSTIKDADSAVPEATAFLKTLVTEGQVSGTDVSGLLEALKLDASESEAGMGVLVELLSDGRLDKDNFKQVMGLAKDVDPEILKAFVDFHQGTGLKSEDIPGLLNKFMDGN
eukprot:m.245614 g.245614  ORF g.245614 m.245614 type:complete len:398 (-) comp16109_c0_seq12:68-1261(-)